MYAKRWKIEEFFKVAKSLLRLDSEFQGRLYYMLIGHATLVCVRYIFLSWNAAEHWTSVHAESFSTIVVMNCLI